MNGRQKRVKFKAPPLMGLGDITITGASKQQIAENVIRFLQGNVKTWDTRNIETSDIEVLECDYTGRKVKNGEVIL